MNSTDLRRMRRELGLSQTGLAERLGVTQATVSRLEAGKTAIKTRDLLAIQQLATALRPAPETHTPDAA